MSRSNEDDLTHVFLVDEVILSLAQNKTLLFLAVDLCTETLIDEASQVNLWPKVVSYFSRNDMLQKLEIKGLPEDQKQSIKGMLQRNNIRFKDMIAVVNAGCTTMNYTQQLQSRGRSVLSAWTLPQVARVDQLLLYFLNRYLVNYQSSPDIKDYVRDNQTGMVKFHFNFISHFLDILPTPRDTNINIASFLHQDDFQALSCIRGGFLFCIKSKHPHKMDAKDEKQIANPLLLDILPTRHDILHR